MLGTLSLNLAFVLYCVLYVPQILHNHKLGDLKGISLFMHGLLYAAYCLDGLYGFLAHLPWQYQCVALLGWLYLNIQQFQICKHFNQSRDRKIRYFCYGLFMLSTLAILCILNNLSLSTPCLYKIGFLAQLGFCTALLPQFIKSQRMQSFQTLSLIYLALNSLLSGLDSLSAWSLHWGWPNKIGSLLVLGLSLTLLLRRSCEH